MNNKNKDVGALSNLDFSHVVNAAKLVKSGKVYDLGNELSKEMPTLGPEYFLPFSLIQYRIPEDMPSDEDYKGYSFSSDGVIGAIHTSSHIDGLIHVQHFLSTYGGHKSSDLRTDFGWKKYGAETIPPIISRGVLLDIADLKGVDRLDDGYEVTIEDCKDALKKQNITIQQGDIVLINTGKIKEFGVDNEKFQSGEPGPGVPTAVWLYDNGMVAMGCDNHGCEVLPWEDSGNSVHRALIIDRGVHLLENLNFQELAKDKVYEFMFVCLPLKIKGATGSWIRPVAIV